MSKTSEAPAKTDAALPAAETPAPDTVTVTLDEPIPRGDAAITRVALRRPRAGELRGLNLAQLLQMQTDALLTLLPRITQPTLLKHELEAMNPADLIQLGTEATGFFLPRAQAASLPE